eukprot:CAMPEP_0182454796 /NCGR_PEP_ID=MMETSP1319-20130603/1263_1 /TAXON_ID=172717 /ORGANISM="Bolidomonas pacifica, Strain RCC208" /LENGTH=554 /DNA_ID=CAMNT_0024652819 /DNA_START=22 /DNA_END=1686 /DNA_ORIENTATION=+
MRVSSFALSSFLLSIPLASAWMPNGLPLSRAYAPHLTPVRTPTYLSVLASPGGIVDIVKDEATSSVEVTISATAEQTKEAYDRVIIDASKNIAIPGFRKGSKVPANVIESVMEKSGGREFLKKQALKQLLSTVVEPALKDHPDVDPIGEPALTQSEEVLVSLFKANEEIQLSVKCDVWPTIKWSSEPTEDSKPYDGLEVAYSRKPFNQAKMDQALVDLRARQAQLAPKEGDAPALEMGDACVVNMVGYMATDAGAKGEPLPNAASGDQVDVVMETGKYMEGLVEGLVGAQINDTREVTVTFPMGLKDKTLAGKTAIFDVTVLSVDTRTLPEIDDEFANNIRPGMNVEKLMEEIKEAVDAEDAREFVGVRNAAIDKALAEKIDMVIPETLVTIQAREKFALMLTEMRDNGSPDSEIKKLVSPENFEKYKDISRDGIVRDLKASMAVEEIARLENIRVSPQEVEEQLANLKKEAGDEYDEGQLRPKVESTLLKNYVMELLTDRAKLDITYEEEGKFDQKLMDELMEQTIKREEEEASKRQEQVAKAAAQAEADQSE